MATVARHAQQAPRLFSRLSTLVSGLTVISSTSSESSQTSSTVSSGTPHQSGIAAGLALT